MIPVYPSDLPCAQIEGFGISVQSGVIRDGSPLHQTSRRVFATMPHSFSVSFVMNPVELTRWVDWMDTYGTGWFEMSLPSMYAGLINKRMAPHQIRLVTPPSMTPASEGYMMVTASFEISPAMIEEYLENAP